MNYQQAIAQLATILALPDQVAPGIAPTPGTQTKAAILAIMQADGLDSTSWIPGDPAPIFADVAARAMAAWGSVPTAACRSMFFALATDPGDVDDFGTPDQSADQTPRPGMLSALGQGWYNTTRGGQTIATSTLVIRNVGSTPTLTFAPSNLSFSAHTLTRSDGGTPTYAGTSTSTTILAAGASMTIQVACSQLGSYGSAAANLIDTCVTQTYGALAVISSTTAIGVDREARSNYIGRCLIAADRLSPGGPGAGYRWAAQSMQDPTGANAAGVPLQRYDGSGATSINQVYVSPASAINQVTVYYGGPAGAVDSIDVSSANANILGILLANAAGTYANPYPAGILPDTVAILPTMNDPNITPHPTPGGASCTNLPVNIDVSLKVKAVNVSGAAVGSYYMAWLSLTSYSVGQSVSNGTNAYVCAVAGTSAGAGGPTGGGAGIVDGSVTWNFVAATATPPSAILTLIGNVQAALGSYLLSTGIGGVDQIAGSGFVYTADFGPTARAVQVGLYDPIVAVPSATATTVPVGYAATQGTVTVKIVVVLGP